MLRDSFGDALLHVCTRSQHAAVLGLLSLVSWPEISIARRLAAEVSTNKRVWQLQEAARQRRLSRKIDNRATVNPRLASIIVIPPPL